LELLHKKTKKAEIFSIARISAFLFLSGMFFSEDSRRSSPYEMEGKQCF